ncbi:c6 zinc finger domain-containing protein [Fusarium heterosporum]|uniref:C6 zinc finger domain-containing protein n=1 Tax=Fusarium heterosporum TaxID=42747 RepID=A0A8H5T7U4_FUSHE|nr:c6 zinc finger domain-containing protein [Fusarium heterosporum]
MDSAAQSPKRLSQRQPRACLECTRRKTRCDKGVPCGRCVRLSKPCSREVVRVSKIERNHGSELTFLDDLYGILESTRHIEAALTAIRERKSVLLHGANSRAVEHNLSGHLSSPVDHPGISNHVAANDAVDLSIKAHEQESRSGSPAGRDTGADGDQHATDFLKIELLAWGRYGGSCFPHVSCQCRFIRPYAEIASITADLEWPGYVYVQPSLNPGIASLSTSQAKSLVRFHLDNILWHHNVFHAPTFLAHCERFWAEGTVVHPLWLSLYYAVLTVSAWTARNCVGLWNDEELDPDLPLHSFHAMVEQLYQEGFAENHSMFSLQAIVLSTRVAHNLGRSDSNATLVGAAIRMAHCMGLHKIQSSSEGLSVNTMDGWFQCIETEVGRRCWNQLLIQDYFQIPVTGTYAIQPSQSTTDLPTNCHDEDMLLQDEETLTINSYPRALARIALVMPPLLDGLTSIQSRASLTETYKVIVKCYSALREVVRNLPTFLMQTSPLESVTDDYLPAWLPFARRSLALSTADKVIMIHRPVLYHAFQVPMLTEARKLCLSAAKAIFKEYESISKEGVIPIWTHSAFCVTAAVVVGLELLFREAHTDEEARSLRSTMKSTAYSLRNRHSDIIAARCAALIDTILSVEEELVVNIMRLSLDGGTSQLRVTQIDMVNKMVKGNEIMAKFLAYSPSVANPNNSYSEPWTMDGGFMAEVWQQDQIQPEAGSIGSDFIFPSHGDFAFMHIT